MLGYNIFLFPDCFVGTPESGLVIFVYAEYGLVFVEAVPGLIF